jgi:hypothetical protein
MNSLMTFISILIVVVVISIFIVKFFNYITTPNYINYSDELLITKCKKHIIDFHLNPKLHEVQIKKIIFELKCRGVDPSSLDDDFTQVMIKKWERDL